MQWSPRNAASLSESSSENPLSWYELTRRPSKSVLRSQMRLSDAAPKLSASPAAAHFAKKQRLSHGTAAAVDSRNELVLGPSALVDAWKAAVSDFRRHETGSSDEVPAVHSALWQPAAALANGVDSSSASDSSSSEESDDAENEQDALALAKAALLAQLDVQEQDMEMDSPAPPVARTHVRFESPAYTPASPNFRPSSPVFVEPAPAPKAAAPVADKSGQDKALSSQELQGLLHSYWQAGYKLGRFHERHGMPDSLASGP